MSPKKTLTFGSWVRLFVLPLGLLALAVIAVSCGYGSSDSGGSATVSGTEAAVSMKSQSFSPSDLTIDKGATVTWTNNDSTTHTVTADGGAFSSGNLAPGKTFNYTFSQTGTFSYHCTIHSNMKGTITVK